jgi:GxxExxY protein
MMAEYLHSELTGKVLAAYFAVYRELGLRRTAYTEGELVQALAVELRRRGLSVRTEVPVVRRYRERRIGEGAVDLVVEEKVAVEVKRVRRLTEEHRAQLEAYLRDGGGRWGCW